MTITVEDRVRSQRGPGRPRCDVSRRAILHAAYELLAEQGIRGFTIERVAARSGVARTTIYRWWASKGALAMEGFLEEANIQTNVRPGPSAVADLRTQVRLYGRLLAGDGGRIVTGILAEGQSDPDTLLAFREGFIEPRRAEGSAILERAIANGELRPGLNPTTVLSALYGPLNIILMLGETLDDAFVDSLTATVLQGWLTGGPESLPPPA